MTSLCNFYRGADKSSARPGRKQANVSVRMASISFGALPCRKKKNLIARVSMLLKSRASLTCFRACFLPGRAKDLSAPLYVLRTFRVNSTVNHETQPLDDGNKPKTRSLQWQSGKLFGRTPMFCGPQFEKLSCPACHTHCADTWEVS